MTKTIVPDDEIQFGQKPPETNPPLEQTGEAVSDTNEEKHRTMMQEYYDLLTEKSQPNRLRQLVPFATFTDRMHISFRAIPKRRFLYNLRKGYPSLAELYDKTDLVNLLPETLDLTLLSSNQENFDLSTKLLGSTFFDAANINDLEQRSRSMLVFSYSLFRYCIEEQEMYAHYCDFLENRGIDLKDAWYAITPQSGNPSHQVSESPKPDIYNPETLLTFANTGKKSLAKMLQEIHETEKVFSRTLRDINSGQGSRGNLITGLRDQTYSLIQKYSGAL